VVHDMTFLGKGGTSVHWACIAMKTVIIEWCAMQSELPPLVRSLVFLFFYVSQRGSAVFFCGTFRPFSQVGNSRLHSTPLNYYSFYGR